MLFLVKESVVEADLNTKADVREQGAMETIQVEAPKFNFEAVRKEKEVGSNMGLD